ncbi:hypothetical protein [Plebeiibacterium sediminum]|uniref:Uncharacterized protein n=1 Tax=Plebeiibacterium sediminum TaxID=2992112 RepID=A0AAE3M3Z8_9BACT|nr:hypothetical protein [Plebeiobacterium sediminum]MCW3786295.1 hypothetical protein [Plebeiobacterium sediminum]
MRTKGRIYSIPKAVNLKLMVDVSDLQPEWVLPSKPWGDTPSYDI